MRRGRSRAIVTVVPAKWALAAGAGPIRQPCSVAPARELARNNGIEQPLQPLETGAIGLAGDRISTRASARKPISRGRARNGGWRPAAHARLVVTRRPWRARWRSPCPALRGRGPDARRRRRCARSLSPAASSAGTSWRGAARGRNAVRVHRVFESRLSRGPLQIICASSARFMSSSGRTRSQTRRNPPADRARMAHGGKPVEPAAARQPEQKCLGLIVQSVRDIERGNAMRPAPFAHQPVARLARCRLDVRLRLRCPASAAHGPSSPLSSPRHDHLCASLRESRAQAMIDREHDGRRRAARAAQPATAASAPANRRRPKPRRRRASARRPAKSCQRAGKARLKCATGSGLFRARPRLGRGASCGASDICRERGKGGAAFFSVPARSATGRA